MYVNVYRLKDGQLLKDKPRRTSHSYRLSEDRQILRLNDLLPADRGIYSCIIQNHYGKLKHDVLVEPVGMIYSLTL